MVGKMGAAYVAPGSYSHPLIRPFMPTSWSGGRAVFGAPPLDAQGRPSPVFSGWMLAAGITVALLLADTGSRRKRRA
jgi:hypothetical protein